MNHSIKKYSVPRIGVGVLIINKNNQVLLGKRKGFCPYYSIVGGHLELGETFEEAAIREVKEETDLTIFNPKVCAITNNLEIFQETRRHYITIGLVVTEFIGYATVQEPEKCEGWAWYSMYSLPKPFFVPSTRLVEMYLNDNFYLEGK